jgi:hypothetical protein
VILILPITDRCRSRQGQLQVIGTGPPNFSASGEQTADPQTEAARRIVAWASLGMLRPTADDFAMLRLVLLALLPQIGGILLMIARTDPAKVAAELG